MYVIATETVSQDLHTDATGNTLIGERSIPLNLPSNQDEIDHPGDDSTPDSSASKWTSGYLTNVSNLILWSFNLALFHLIGNQYHV